MFERFFRSFKEKRVCQRSFLDINDAYNRIADWIDHCNKERSHSTLGYAPPAEVRPQLVT
jgi:transposase InsO family protein